MPIDCVQHPIDHDWAVPAVLPSPDIPPVRNAALPELCSSTAMSAWRVAPAQLLPVEVVVCWTDHMDLDTHQSQRRMQTCYGDADR